MLSEEGFCCSLKSVLLCVVLILNEEVSPNIDQKFQVKHWSFWSASNRSSRFHWTIRRKIFLNRQRSKWIDYNQSWIDRMGITNGLSLGNFRSFFQTASRNISDLSTTYSTLYQWMKPLDRKRQKRNIYKQLSIFILPRY